MGTKITVTDLWKDYPLRNGSLPVLEGIDFTVAEGEFVALSAPRGAASPLSCISWLASTGLTEG